MNVFTLKATKIWYFSKLVSKEATMKVKVQRKCVKLLLFIYLEFNTHELGKSSSELGVV